MAISHENKDIVLRAYRKSLVSGYPDKKDTLAAFNEDLQHIKSYFQRYADAKGHSISKTVALQILELLTDL